MHWKSNYHGPWLVWNLELRDSCVANKSALWSNHFRITNHTFLLIKSLSEKMICIELFAAIILNFSSSKDLIGGSECLTASPGMLANNLAKIELANSIWVGELNLSWRTKTVTWRNRYRIWRTETCMWRTNALIWRTSE